MNEFNRVRNKVFVFVRYNHYKPFCHTYMYTLLCAICLENIFGICNSFPGVVAFRNVSWLFMQNSEIRFHCGTIVVTVWFSWEWKHTTTLQNLLFCWMDTVEGMPVNTFHVYVFGTSIFNSWLLVDSIHTAFWGC